MSLLPGCVGVLRGVGIAGVRWFGGGFWFGVGWVGRRRVLGVAVAILRRVLDTKIRNENDLEQVTDVPVLGVVPFDSGAEAHPVVIRDDPLSVRAEAVRRLRTNLQFVEAAEHSRSVVVTSVPLGPGAHWLPIPDGGALGVGPSLEPELLGALG